RRRHTRSTRDWSSDVCSSDLWYIVYSSDNSIHYGYWGGVGDTPVVADYDGDGRSDIAVWRSSDSTWYISYSNGGGNQFQWGVARSEERRVGQDGDGGVRRVVE